MVLIAASPRSRRSHAMTIRRRPLIVASVSYRPTVGCDTPRNLDRILAEAERYVVRAARMGAELVAFPEAYPQLGTSDVFHHAEPVDGGSLPRIQELAKRHSLSVVWPRIEYAPDRGGLRNSAILVGRDGAVVGRYDKMFPTDGEMAKGAIPGTELPTFETDFGRLAMLICFDMNFPEVHQALAAGKPDVVVFSSMYRGGLQAHALAFELGAFVVTSISAELGQVIDRCGRVLKESTYEALGVAPINTNSVALHMDHNWDKMDAMLEKYGPELTFDYHTREAYYVIESTGARDIAELAREFELVSFADYYDRTRQLRAEALAKLARAKSSTSGG
jgi:predicted amidohydrolase